MLDSTEIQPIIPTLLVILLAPRSNKEVIMKSKANSFAKVDLVHIHIPET
ncbi:hypothetical protein SAMN05428978_1001173 [Nitrosomonas sp. Nm34]|nr:hypothetical protein SAMN05428978_1001173 [Nitrosomonas sp. Nm34]